MKNYASKESTQCQAMQYGTDVEADQYVKHCYVGYQDEIRPIPGDMMGTPKNAFYAVKTASGWQKIEKGDFVVLKDDEALVMPQGVFKLSFEEV